jgi:hypothetical protein
MMNVEVAVVPLCRAGLAEAEPDEIRQNVAHPKGSASLLTFRLSADELRAHRGVLVR